MASQADRRAATVGTILAEARRLFTERGFEATSVDDVAEAAGVAKGAVYHHFASKEALFQRVLEGMQAAIATSVPAEAPAPSDLVDQIAAATLHYLLTASEPAFRRVLLIDGPAVIGWRRWREIDDRFFGAGARAAVAMLLGPAAAPGEVETVSHLLLGAVMEAALVCATAPDPKQTARAMAQGLQRMLRGLAAQKRP